jgi:hypothetical protein
MRAWSGLKPPDMTSSSGRFSCCSKRVVGLVSIMACHYHIAGALGTILAAKTANAKEFVDTRFLEELDK